MPSPTVTVLLIVALVLRVTVVLYSLRHFGPAWFFSRGSEMGFVAASLLHGQGLSSPFGVATGPTAIVAPGYPLLVAAVFQAFGTYTCAAALCLMLLNTCCNILTVHLIYGFARLFAGAHAAAAAALFWACSLPLLWMPTIFWETSISCMLVVGLLALSSFPRSLRSLWFWFVFGVLAGFAGLINPALLPSFLVLTLCLCFRSPSRIQSWRPLATVVTGFVLVFSPWPIRNAREFHACVLSRTTVGLELWMGNHSGSDGFLNPGLFPTYNMSELASYQRQGEIRYTTTKGQFARAFIETHPSQFARLSGQRFLRFWTGTGTEGGSYLFGLHATLTSCFGLWGFVLLWKRRHRQVCLHAGIFLLLFPLPYYITHAEFRYRLVLDPLLSALAAAALEPLLASLRSAGKPSSSRLASIIPNLNHPSV